MGSKIFDAICLASILCLCFIPCTNGFFNALNDFTDFIRPLCYNKTSDGKTLINGQELPLSQTFDNFLYLVEKLEDANQETSITDLLYIILKNYTHENIKPNGDEFISEKPLNADIHLLDELWESPDANEEVLLRNNNPLTDSEICSLFYMLSHAVNDNPTWFDDQNAIYAPINREGVFRSETTKFPREKGIVVMRSTDETIAMSRVLLGVYLGITGQEKDAKEIAGKKKQTSLPVDTKFLPLQIFTLADTLVYNVWPPKTKDMGHNVVNFLSVNSRNIKPDLSPLICPTTFQLAENASSMYTYSLVRGGVDGLILGQISKKLVEANSHVRLSQILRSYYSYRGIQVAGINGDPATTVFSSCHRLENFLPLIDELKRQIELLTAIISQIPASNSALTKLAFEAIETRQAEILHHDCGPPKVDERPCETPVDIIVVLDTKSNKIERQIDIVGQLANKLDLLHDRSSITVLLDQLVDSSGFNLTEVVPKTSSSAAAACAIVQEEIGRNGLERERVIQSLDNYLSELKEQDRELDGAAGKIVLYFNFEDQETETSALKSALNNFLRKHRDVSIFAVGENADVLKKYIGLNNHGVLKLNDRDVESLVKELANKMCTGPAAFQYSECKTGKNENSAAYEGFVTRGSVQHWAMNPQYYEKSLTAKIFFDADNGNNFKVCHNRGTEKPDAVENNCDNATSTKRRLEYKTSNPCENMKGAACATMYFSVIGSEPEEKDTNKYCSDPRCKSLNQVKFRVTHDGIRCSGCSSLLSSSILVVLAVCLRLVFG